MASYDSTEGGTAPPSLKIDTCGTDGKGQVAQLIACNSGEKLNINGSVKCLGSGMVSLAVQYYDDRSSPIRFEHLFFAKQGDGWQSGGKTVTLPERAVTLGIVLYAEGVGKGWLDDVAITRVP
ncbi:MAG: hypothetical protein H7145_21720 [Akkermansiaceae bacterium]|nr:hypothetical protein [Armatimonadota bacterium]